MESEVRLSPSQALPEELYEVSVLDGQVIRNSNWADSSEPIRRKPPIFTMLEQFARIASNLGFSPLQILAMEKSFLLQIWAVSIFKTQRLKHYWRRYGSVFRPFRVFQTIFRIECKFFLEQFRSVEAPP